MYTYEQLTKWGKMCESYERTWNSGVKHKQESCQLHAHITTVSESLIIHCSCPKLQSLFSAIQNYTFIFIFSWHFLQLFSQLYSQHFSRLFLCVWTKMAKNVAQKVSKKWQKKSQKMLRKKSQKNRTESVSLNGTLAPYKTDEQTGLIKFGSLKWKLQPIYDWSDENHFWI